MRRPDEYMNVVYSLCAAYERQSYVEGIKVGARLMMEMMERSQNELIRHFCRGYLFTSFAERFFYALTYFVLVG